MKYAALSLREFHGLKPGENASLSLREFHGLKVCLGVNSEKGLRRERREKLFPPSLQRLDQIGDHGVKLSYATSQLYPFNILMICFARYSLISLCRGTG